MGLMGFPETRRLVDCDALIGRLLSEALRGSLATWGKRTEDQEVMTPSSVNSWLEQLPSIS